MKNRLMISAGLVAVVCGVALGAQKAPEATTLPVVSSITPAPVKLTAEQTQFFEAKVRPILSANCYKCHSVEQGKAKGKLTLDTREGVLKGGENGAVVVPGDPAKSKLITAVTYADPDLQMPPKGEKLGEKEIAALTEWVKLGAPDPRVAGAAAGKLTGLTDKARAHWAYQPVKDPAVPEVYDKKWVRTPVDAFILAKLEKNEMKPSAPASKETLIRRATYDLIGLPPTPEEVRAFEQDTSPNAFEKVVDRLLASPHYGERWGRFWLDSARYSDTSGIEKNNRKEDYRYADAWTYRDYVIKAFNDDKPYDRFLMEQIAADQLPDAPKDSLAALGFITVGKRFANPNDTIDERIDTLGKATMGLTIACARCHDHKFDPIPTADYYSLHGIFASTVEPAERPLIGKGGSGPAYQDYLRKVAAVEQKNRDIYFNYVESKSAEFRSKASVYLLTSLYFKKNQQEMIQRRNKLIQENRLDRDLYQNLRVVRQDQELFAPLLRFSQIPEEQFAARAPEVLKEVLRGRIAGRREINPLVVAAFKGVEPASLKSIEDVAAVYGRLFKEIDPKAKAYIAACRNAKTDADVRGFDENLVALINCPAEVEPAGKLTTDELKAVAARLPQQNNRAYQQFAFNEINELDLTHPGAPARAMAVVDSDRPHNSPIFIRGEAQNRGPIVPRQFLEILSGKDRKPFKIGSGRLELAKAIANKDNPLTARVMINRIWMHHFGEGFVRTPDDLGVQSEPPSHPELLDYLASRFVESGWSVKKMHRLIMLSSAYQQSSDNNAAYAQKDPDNRLVWRANLRRLDFEAIRDSMLQFTGKLDPTIGGKPVNLTDEPYSNRRSVYGYIDRGSVPELMEQFDFADPDMANSRRVSTIVPQQALFFMNSPMSVDVARKVTSRPEFVNARDDFGRVRAIYQVLFQRAPKPEEVKFAAQFYDATVTQRDGPPGAARGGNGAVSEQVRAKQRQRQMERMQRQQQLQKKADRGGKRPVRNEGEMVERRPLTVWEEYAQALLFTNEVAYVN